MGIYGTTILAVKRKGVVVVGGDGQVTMGNTIIKKTGKKVRLLYGNKVIGGFAGSVADALMLFDIFEKRLEEASGNLRRACINFAKEWRSDKILRRLEALMIVASKDDIFLISGAGDIIEPDEDVVAIGSGGMYAFAAAKALIENTRMNAEDIVRKSLEITGDICIYTNKEITLQRLGK